MLNKLRIQNFKCWEDTGTIDMAPITLFFGANSSGKSSIGQFLMMLKQTVEEHDQEAVFYLGGENSVVQLSSYNEMVFQNNLESNIRFEYQWSPNRVSDIKFLNPPNNPLSGDGLAFQAKVDFPDSKSSPIPSISEFEYELIKEDGELQLLFGMKRKENRYSDQKEWYYVTEALTPNSTPKFKLKRRTSSDPYVINKEIAFYKSPIKFYRFPRQVTDTFTNAEGFSTKFHYEHEELFSSLFYIGPFRTNKRWYNYQGPPESVGSDGRHTVGAILAAQDRNYKIEIGTISTELSFEAFIALKLKDMGLIEEFKVQRINQQMYEVKIKTKGGETWVNLSDVGFGVSQVLPVLVQCFYAPEKSIILIDQPEVHLHPYAQSALADVMIDVIESKSDLGKGFKERNIQLIIETHSEHFLRRLQRRIAEGKLSEDKVAAYFASINDKVPLAKWTELKNNQRDRFEEAGISSANDLASRSIDELIRIDGIGPAGAKKWKESAKKYVEMQKEKAQLERLKIDEYGNIQNWPENFFGDEMGDITAQAKAAMKKRMQTTHS